jgi:Spy/CpxP family protein refolding chaperone
MLTTVAYERCCTFGRPHRPRHPGHPFALLRGELALTKEQMAQLEAQRSALESELRGTRTQLREKRQALMESLRADKPDTLSIDRLVEEIGALQVGLEKQMIRHMMDERRLLTPEQRQKFYLMIRKHFRDREDASWVGPGGGPFEEIGPGSGHDVRRWKGHHREPARYAPPDSGRGE